MLTSLGTAVIGIASWFAVSHIELVSRVSALESDAKEDTRQDEELREIRKTMQDMVVLFFHEHGGPTHDIPAELAGVDESTEEPVEPTTTYAGEDADEAFSAVQMDLESVLRGQGIEPAKKAAKKAAGDR